MPMVVQAFTGTCRWTKHPNLRVLGLHMVDTTTFRTHIFEPRVRLVMAILPDVGHTALNQPQSSRCGGL
jgi:hypothetical protein